MRVISKKISLEEFTSRLPGIVPAYMNGKKYLFDEESLKAREYEFPSNYGMIPMNITIPGDLSVPILTDTTRCLSWSTISDWYYFFTNYYHLLNDWGRCCLKYNSAVEYYSYESKNGYADQMIYGTDEDVYIELDETFRQRGGKIEVITEDDMHARKKDVGMFKWLCDYIIPSLEIPGDLVDVWHCNRLYYPDIVKWRSWFNKRDYTSIDTCPSATNCCDCEEYFKRGGMEMKQLLNSFILPNTNEFVCNTDECDKHCKVSAEIPLSLQVSIDDMGEFSILSKEYELGIDYRTARYGDSSNEHYGTVISIDGESMKLKSGSGFTFNSTYMEKKFSKDDWVVNSGNTICSGITEEEDDVRYFSGVSSHFFYGFGEDWKRISGNTEEQVRSSITKNYPIEPTDSVYIRGELYEIQKEEYCTVNDKIYCVYRDEYTSTPYVILDGKKIYAESKPHSKDEFFYFPFLTSGITVYDETCNKKAIQYCWFPRERKEGDLKDFILLNGVITSASTESERVKGTFSNDDGFFYVKDDNKVYYADEYLNLILDDEYIVVDSHNAKMVINDDIKVFEAGIITGKTSSKLYDLRSNSLLTDDTGEVIQGRYDVSGKTNHQPSQDDALDLIYEVGNTANIVPFNEAGKDCYYGDIITSMVFYHEDYEGNVIDGTEKNWTEFNNSLSAIVASESAASGMVISGYAQSDIYCDIEYLIGATLSGTPQTIQYDDNTLFVGTKYSPIDDSTHSKGVKHKETVRFKKKNVLYKLSKGVDGQIPTTFNTVSANSLCYPVTVYELDQDMTEINSVYGNKYQYALADFEMTLPQTNDGWSGYTSATQIFPVFRQEYMLGSAVMQNIDVDIYIDRGINAAFEKHLKLGEVTSMEALEQYSNGYFKMMDN